MYAMVQSLCTQNATEATRERVMQVGVRELRAQLRHWLDRVREGDEVVVTEHGRPVARIVPADAGSAMDRLVADGTIVTPTARRRPSSSIQHVASTGSVAELVP